MQPSAQPWVLFVSPKGAFSVDPGPLEYFTHHFVCRPMSEGWAPPNIKVSGQSRAPKDFVSWVSTAPIVSERAKTAIQSIPGANVEYLPILNRAGQAFYALNVLEESDELDFDRSKLILDENSNSIPMIEEARFKFNNGSVPPIFKIRGYGGEIFVSTLFAHKIRGAKLTGALFLDPARDISKRVLAGDVHDDFPGHRAAQATSRTSA